MSHPLKMNIIQTLRRVGPLTFKPLPRQSKLRIIIGSQWKSKVPEKLSSSLFQNIGTIPSHLNRIDFRKFRLMKLLMRFPSLSQLDWSKSPSTLRAESPSILSSVKENLRREILTIRIWNTSEHVSWLVFEVIGRLQIRPHQHAAVQSLIKNPGMISQINMGDKCKFITPLFSINSRSECLCDHVSRVLVVIPIEIR
jgi:hypothetical protein